MEITVDSIEGDFLVAEFPDSSFSNLPLELFEKTHEGDVFLIYLHWYFINTWFVFYFK